MAGCNKVKDFSEIERLGSLPLLEEVTLYGNPLVRRGAYRPAVIKKCVNL